MLALGLRFHLARLLFHPLIQPRFLEPPAIPQLERGNLLLADVLVQSVRTHAQILRRLANVHHFSRVGHSSFALSRLPFPPDLSAPTGFLRETSSPCLSAQRAIGVPSIYQPRKTAPRRESPRFSGFCTYFLELRNRAERTEFYILWFSNHQLLDVVCTLTRVLGHPPTGN